MTDTIFAVATAFGKAGVAIIRISGPQAPDIIEKLSGFVPEPRISRLVTLRGSDELILDQALVLFFREGASFTGEDVVELHVHGSIAVVRAVLAEIEKTGLAREAKPGEFTRRALMNDRLDLTQVQGLADVIEAETEMQRQHAMRVLGGELSERVARWRASLVRAIALIEATIDFADEEVPSNVWPEVDQLLADLSTDLMAEAQGTRAARRLHSGFEVAFVGRPNVGKSTLLNTLSRSDAAIVSDQPGTTRDVVEVRLDLGGIPVTLLDMAGLRQTVDKIEEIGVRRAVERANTADLRIFLHDDGKSDFPGVSAQPGDLVVRTKIDLLEDEQNGISAKNGVGVDGLVSDIRTELEQRVSKATLASTDREATAIQDALERLHIIRKMRGGDDELIVAELQQAARALGQLIGAVDVENVLDEVFKSFCLGK